MDVCGMEGIGPFPKPQNTKKPRDLRGFLGKRLKGLEPSTFCMANGFDDPIFRRVGEIWLV
jgi:hypothetical protein